MKKTGIILTALFLIMATTDDLHAQGYRTALGIRISSDDAIVNNSVSLKYFFSGTTAVEGLLSFGDPVALGLLLEKHRPAGNSGLSLFYGGGAYIGFGSTKNIGAQGVLGLDYKLPSIPLNLSLDWKPELNIVKETVFEPAAVGASIRFTFN
jgi:hypothetical protein